MFAICLPLHRVVKLLLLFFFFSRRYISEVTSFRKGFLSKTLLALSKLKSHIPPSCGFLKELKSQILPSCVFVKAYTLFFFSPQCFSFSL